MAKFSFLMRFGGIHAFQEIVFEVNMNFEIVSHIQVSFFYGSMAIKLLTNWSVTDDNYDTELAG